MSPPPLLCRRRCSCRRPCLCVAAASPCHACVPKCSRTQDAGSRQRLALACIGWHWRTAVRRRTTSTAIEGFHTSCYTERGVEKQNMKGHAGAFEDAKQKRAGRQVGIALRWPASVGDGDDRNDTTTGMVSMLSMLSMLSYVLRCGHSC